MAFGTENLCDCNSKLNNKFEIFQLDESSLNEILGKNSDFKSLLYEGIACNNSAFLVEIEKKKLYYINFALETENFRFKD